MKILVELLFTAVFVSLVLAQDYVEKQDDQYYPSEPSQHRSRYGSSYGRYGGYRHRQGYGYGCMFMFAFMTEIFFLHKYV